MNGESDENDRNDNEESYRVYMDGGWELEDLYTFPHAFSQCYAFIYCLD